MVKSTKLYDILGVSTSATKDEINKAYKKLAIKYHPDKFAMADEKTKEEMSEKFKEINRANEVLSDPETRNNYNRFGEDAPQDHGMNPFDGFFPFGSAPRQVRKISPIPVPLSISLEDLFHCRKKKLKYTRKILCKTCKGLGGENVISCNKCDGKGVIVRMIQLGPNMIQQAQTPCNKCQGKGKSVEKICKKCQGQCIIDDDVEEMFQIPKGVKNGEKVIISGKGHHPSKDIEQGDVIVLVEVQSHPVFQQKAYNLCYEHSVDLTTALCGGQLLISHLGGHKILIKIDAIIHPDQLYYIRNEGLPSKNGQDKGDLIIKFNIKFPKSLTDDVKAGLCKLLGDPHHAKINSQDDYYESTLQPFNGSMDEAKSDSDDEPQQMGGQGVQCNQQ